MGVKTEVKFQPYGTELAQGSITVVVGQNPGRQRNGEQNNVAWCGNRSGDLMMEVAARIPNLYLTNVCNYQEMNNDRIQEGLRDIRNFLLMNRVDKIVCLGLFAYENIKSIDTGNIPVKVFHHPSFVLRFNKNPEQYKRRLKMELMK